MSPSTQLVRKDVVMTWNELSCQVDVPLERPKQNFLRKEKKRVRLGSSLLPNVGEGRGVVATHCYGVSLKKGFPMKKGLPHG